MTYSLTLHRDLGDYGRQQGLKWRHAAFAITITNRLHEQIHRELREDLPPRIGLAPMGVDPEIFRRTEHYAPWKGIGPLRLFSCGRLNPSKGHQHLINAVSLLKKSDGLALLGHVDDRESRPDKDRRHCTAAVFILVHTQPHGYPWNGIVHPAIRNHVNRNPRPFLAGRFSHPSGVLPALIASFSSFVLRCLGTDTIVASMIWPPRAM
jgi:glycosyltransferase involved in cell wall biosynthesis